LGRWWAIFEPILLKDLMMSRVGSLEIPNKTRRQSYNFPFSSLSERLSSLLTILQLLTFFFSVIWKWWGPEWGIDSQKQIVGFRQLGLPISSPD